MLFNLSNFTNPYYIVQLLLSIPIVLFSLSFHEASHAYAAHKLGDDTAKNLGRLTLNPLKHLDPIGALAMLFFGIGWAKPVPILTRNFDHPKRGMIISAAAGPLSNLILSVVGVLLYVPFAYFLGSSNAFTSAVSTFLYLFHYMNLALAVFNLLPIPPLDGSRVLFGFLPDRLYFGIMKYERYIQIGFIALILILHNFFNFSIVSFVCEPMSNGMIWLIRLIPIFR